MTVQTGPGLTGVLFWLASFRGFFLRISSLYRKHEGSIHGIRSAGTEMGCFAFKASVLCLHVLSEWHNRLCKVVMKMYIGFCRQ